MKLIKNLIIIMIKIQKLLIFLIKIIRYLLISKTLKNKINNYKIKIKINFRQFYIFFANFRQMNIVLKILKVFYNKMNIR